MLENLFGTKTASLILLHLYHYGDLHARGIARDINISVSSVQKRLDKFEDLGIVVSKMIGTSKVFSFNKKSPLVKPLTDLLKVYHSSLSLKDKEVLFKDRKRPRRSGKPVIGRTRK